MRSNWWWLESIHFISKLQSKAELKKKKKNLRHALTCIPEIAKQTFQLWLTELLIQSTDWQWVAAQTLFNIRWSLTVLWRLPETSGVFGVSKGCVGVKEKEGKSAWRTKPLRFKTYGTFVSAIKLTKHHFVLCFRGHIAVFEVAAKSK